MLKSSEPNLKYLKLKLENNRLFGLVTKQIILFYNVEKWVESLLLIYHTVTLKSLINTTVSDSPNVLKSLINGIPKEESSMSLYYR